MQLINNIDSFKFLVDDNPITYFPKNTRLENKTLNRIFAYLGTFDRHSGPEQDPETGNILLNWDVPIFVTLVSKSNQIIANNIPMLMLNYYNFFTLSEEINWGASFINIPNAAENIGKEVCIFMIYDSAEKENVEYKKIIDINTENRNYSLAELENATLANIIGTPNYGRLVGIESQGANIWIELSDKLGRTFSPIPISIFSVDDGTGLFRGRKVNPLRFNYLDLDYTKTHFVGGQFSAITFLFD